MNAEQIPKVLVNGLYFKYRGDVDYSEPGAASGSLNEFNGFVDVVVEKGRLLERNEAVHAQEQRIRGGDRSNIRRFFARTFSGSYADACHRRSCKCAGSGTTVVSKHQC